MKVIRHPKAPWPGHMTINANPLCLFILKTVELRIEAGDTLGEVAKVLQREWRYDEATCREIAAMYFAMGERRGTGHNGVWNTKELDTRPSRKYAPGIPYREPEVMTPYDPTRENRRGRERKAAKA